MNALILVVGAVAALMLLIRSLGNAPLDPKIFESYGDVEEFELAFANGGDQNNDTIPERPVCDEVGIALIDGLGDKIQSSSWLLKKM